ncbi:hypothetical protein FIA58_010010 [Flavobacterium jejuense]|uniref:MORN repeat variant n=1 Tax=Flavobacterium jejuense TaxID=1544455 RepID=A0ABX0ITZ8_9FLAO|nr:hypothetical protein [Flavobacterium jejuense]NHN26008.1 hypothetical protein [Flavobacterium jejuense]
MKNSMYFLFFLLTNMNLLAQEIKYKPVFINQCTKEEDKTVTWNIIDKKQRKPLKKQPFDVEVLLPRLGEFELVYDFNDAEHIKIEKTGTTIDTIFLEKIRMVYLVSHPPILLFQDCSTNATGKITDYYSSGKIRATGTFENGKLTDTLKKYDKEGIITDIEIPYKKGNRLLHYYKDGQIKEEVNYWKKYKKLYYETGKLAEYESWKGKEKLISYFENGTLKRLRNSKKQETFSKEGILVDKITRKEILILERLFSFNRDDRNHRFYEYDWEQYDEKGTVKCKIVYYESNYSLIDFPDSLQQIAQSSIDKTTFYQKGITYKKITTKYLKEDNNYKKWFIIYRKENEEWIEEETVAVEDFFLIFEKYITK